jgi:hypothetical protein
MGSFATDMSSHITVCAIYLLLKKLLQFTAHYLFILADADGKL